MGGFVRQQLDAFLFVFFFGELSGSTRTEATRTSPLARCFPNSLVCLRSSWATCLFRGFLSDGLPSIVRHYLRANSFFLFLWVLSAHLRCDLHHSRQRTVFVSVARTHTLSSVPCWAVLNPSSGRTHVIPLAP